MAGNFLKILDEVINEKLESGSIIVEVLTQAQQKRVNRWKKGDNSFTDTFFGGPDTDKENFQRRHFDFQHDDSGVNSPVKSEIEKHLDQHGYKIASYQKGLAKNAQGREIRIGRVLANTKADSNILKKYNEDPTRTNKNARNLKILISRHPHDVAGMTSCGQSWEDGSCMNFEKGTHKKYLSQDIKHGTHVAYLVPHDDLGHPQKPIARIAIKKHTSEDGNYHILVPEPKVYGEAPAGFDKQVQDIVDGEHNDHLPGGNYKKTSQVYHDWGAQTVVNVGKDFESAVSNRFDTGLRIAALKSRRATTAHLDKALTDLDVWTRGAVLENPNAQAHHIEKALGNEDRHVRERAQELKNKMAPAKKDPISEAISSFVTESKQRKFEPRVRFNWGYHDAVVDFSRGKPRKTITKGEHNLKTVSKTFDSSYFYGYEKGLQHSREDRASDNSTEAWNEHRNEKKK